MIAFALGLVALLAAIWFIGGLIWLLGRGGNYKLDFLMGLWIGALAALMILSALFIAFALGAANG